MEHKGTVLLETQRLILRRFTPEDSEPAFRNWTSDSMVTKFLRWPTHIDSSVTKRVLSGWLEGYCSDAFYQWAIVIKELGEPVGTISVTDIDERSEKAHVGYCIGSYWWNKGYMSEAFSAVITFLFEVVKVQRIETQHYPNNPGSGRVMQKCGLTYEGTLRKADWNNTGIVDACVYSILADEYNRK